MDKKRKIEIDQILKKTEEEMKRKDLDKRIIFGGVTFALVCLVTILSVIFVKRNETATDEMISVENDLNAQQDDCVQIVSDVNVSENQTVDDQVIDEPQKEVSQVINYTSIYEDEESLKQLVIDTIQSANIQIGEARLDAEFRTMSIIMDAVDDARQNGNLGGTFKPLGDESNPLPDDKQNWTYFDVSGAIGGLLFNEKDPVGNLLEQSDLLKNLVAEGVYLFDSEKLEIHDMNGTFETVFVDTCTGNYDVNFEINMNYEGQEWVALIGNVDHAYRVLDIVKAEDLENFVVYTGTKTETVAQSQNVVNEESIEETVNVSVQEQIEQNNVVQQSDPLSYLEDPNYDPYVGAPNYTGPREGYHYCWQLEDYIPDGVYNLSEYLYGTDLMGIESSISREEYEAAGGQYHGY